MVAEAVSNALKEQSFSSKDSSYDEDSSVDSGNETTESEYSDLEEWMNQVHEEDKEPAAKSKAKSVAK